MSLSIPWLACGLEPNSCPVWQYLSVLLFLLLDLFHASSSSCVKITNLQSIYFVNSINPSQYFLHTTLTYLVVLYIQPKRYRQFLAHLYLTYILVLYSTLPEVNYWSFNFRKVNERFRIWPLKNSSKKFPMFNLLWVKNKFYEFVSENYKFAA